MKRVIVLGLATVVALAALPRGAGSHCQVPCGIYDDEARIARMAEDATTIGKVIDSINDLAGKGDAQSANQLTRWIVTKEAHATNIITIVSEYFLTQKVKPAESGSDDYAAYLEKLADHHRVMRAAMKTKQSADPATALALSTTIDALAVHYTDH